MADLSELIERVGGLHAKLAKSHPKLERGQVWCRTCGHTQRVDSADCLRHGWPKCCGYTMTIDAPGECDTPALRARQKAPDGR